LVTVQDEDGAFRKFTYLGHAATYYAHASCWLAELGRYVSNETYLRAAGRHLDWVLNHYDSKTGWFDRSGFSREDHDARRAVTHTIAYTIWGVLTTSLILEHTDGIAAATKTAERVARRLELSGLLPGILDSHWRPLSTFACLTGNVQMALIWFKLHEVGDDARFVNAALKAIDLVKAFQPLNHPKPEIRGGIFGSAPLWGSYISFALPNWSAKFFIDALVAKQEVLGRLRDHPSERTPIAVQVPMVLPELSKPGSSDRLKIVMYTAEGSHKVPQMVEAWSAWSFQPAAVVMERRRKPRLRDRILAKIREEGLKKLLKRILVGKSASGKTSTSGVLTDSALQAEARVDVAAFCSARGISLITVESLETPEALESLRTLSPDLAVHAGAGILRKPVLAIPRLGTLNAHMGILPAYRGMNVTEWAAFNGDPVGCTVHLIDPGIDTGDILCARVSGLENIPSIAELRAAVDRDQIALLGEVVQYATQLGVLPPGVTQEKPQGKQYFRMHSDLAAILEERLRNSVTLVIGQITTRQEGWQTTRLV
jgi:folate-dependent phosphoribosylglycinamide formyltransferase PurN